MTAPNHITGGTVFTGLFCSLFEINIFSSPLFIILVIIGSILPDIDHTKSLIGKLFYPISKYISKNYGHRTITHSAIFLFLITSISLFLEKYFLNNYEITIILFFSILSHLILDMCTLQGIPLFYPFYKNPCVLPANPDLRIRTGDIKSEGVILFIFSISTIFMQDLFANGFWSNLNNQFNDITHTQKEFSNTNNLLNVDFEYSDFNKKIKGNGIIINSVGNEIFILDSLKIHRLKKGKTGMMIKTLQTKKTEKILKINQKSFINISLDSLNTIMKNKFIYESSIFSNQKINVVSSKGLINKNEFKFSNEYNLKFTQSFKDSISYDLESKIKEIDFKIKREKKQVYLKNKIQTENLEKIKNLENSLKSEKELFKINEIKNEIIFLKSKIKSFKKYESSSLKSLELNKIQLEENQNKIRISIFGNIKYLEE